MGAGENCNCTEARQCRSMDMPMHLGLPGHPRRVTAADESAPTTSSWVFALLLLLFGLGRVVGITPGPREVPLGASGRATDCPLPDSSMHCCLRSATHVLAPRDQSYADNGRTNDLTKVVRSTIVGASKAHTAHSTAGR